MEPWLDSLSEDWKSEHRSSSPAASFSSSRQSNGSVAVSQSQSRIPHLAKNIRKDSSTGSFLRHRSTRGQARANSDVVLRERSASSLNTPAQSGSQKHTSLPRRPSSAFSESQNSVQHYTIDEKPAPDQTPEWKRRLVNGEDLGSDGFDLFSPSKLEGIFARPAPAQLPSDNAAEQKEGNSNARKPFNLPVSNSFSDQYSSIRQTRSLPNLEVLEEVNEEEELSRADLSALSPDPAREGSLRGLVRHRVQSFEQANATRSGPSSPAASSDPFAGSERGMHDPRWRTVSGQEELKNELISPVTVSKQNSIRATVLRNSLEADIHSLGSRVGKMAPTTLDRPTSSSSDREISYTNRSSSHPAANNEPLPDLTSQSLPDDLSMGTQDFISHGGFINSRRGGRSNETSFLRKSLSLSQEPPHVESHSQPLFQFHSSPPQPSRLYDESIEQSKFSASAPTTPQDTSVVHHAESSSKPASSGSPLKLFGNRDTYTNNKLLRILSQFEEPSDLSQIPDDDDSLPEEQQDNALRMSQFGKGDLDGFGFAQDIPKPSPVERALVRSDDRIFKSVSTNPGKEQEAVNGAGRSGTIAQKCPNNNGQSRDAGFSEKDRTTKRRKTLVKDKVNIEGHELEFKISQLDETTTLAGRKRKDARPGDDGTLADPEVLASRSLLKPKLPRRESVNQSPSEEQDESVVEDAVTETPAEGLTEALAAELASFAQEAAQFHNDSRKPSLATKDYMEEANKVMQFIRSRGKPKPVLPDISEPGNASELNPDAILDLDIDADSTRDDFSRPPSRERSSKPVPDRRHARHDSRTASYLRKYQDQDDMDVLASTSVFGTLAPNADKQVPNQASTPAFDDSQESSPPNMRIRNHSETMRKRKHSTSTVDAPLDSTLNRQLQSQNSAGSSTQRTFPTSSSTSGHKGVIASGTVSIPDHVGLMTFDHEKKMWVKKMASKDEARPFSRMERTEDDPFGDIPDLSIDEQQELERARLARSAEKENAPPPAEKSTDAHTQAHRHPLAELDVETVEGKDQRDHELEDEEEHVNQSSLRSKASEHEAKLHDGVASKPPPQFRESRKQARVVTIAFSSPVVSGVNYANMSDQDFEDLPREEDLPLDDSEIDIHDETVDEGLPHYPSAQKLTDPVEKNGQDVYSEHKFTVAFQPRTISPIAEGDEEHVDGQMSVIRVEQSNKLTPAASRTISKLQKAGNKASSILCLTPLSDFSVHQIDSAKHPDQSYVEERKHPNALRQAHGSLALAVDELVKAITDAVPDELYWEQLRRLTLKTDGLTSVHGLKEYCPILEQLSVCDNQLTQAGGLPESLRELDIHNNMLNDLTSWGHLHNLQYLDVSGNQLESLEGFSSLVHLRSLKANDNHISNIDGILDLDGLLELQLGGNHLVSVDFEGSELTRLRSLDLSHNQLAKVQNIHCLPQLEELDLSHNLLEGFGAPSEKTHVLTLRDLRLSHNQLSVIELGSMPDIERLDLDNNSIQDIRGLPYAYHLEMLSLREQQGSSGLIDLVLSTPNDCREIRLSSNPTPNGTFRLPAVPQNNLRELEIAACGISELPQGFGACFPNCRALNANFNAIGDISPLRKMVRLKSLLLAKNRIRRLRRTCLVLARLGFLESVDLRDNPLTVGFYSPITKEGQHSLSPSEARYHLPEGSQVEDAAWMKVLDEITGLKRRTIELLLVDHCKNLVRLDGLALCRDRICGRDGVWRNLTAQGVLQTPAPAAAGAGGDAMISSHVAEEAADGHGEEEESTLTKDSGVGSMQEGSISGHANGDGDADLVDGQC